MPISKNKFCYECGHALELVRGAEEYGKNLWLCTNCDITYAYVISLTRIDKITVMNKSLKQTIRNLDWELQKLKQEIKERDKP